MENQTPQSSQPQTPQPIPPQAPQPLVPPQPAPQPVPQQELAAPTAKVAQSPGAPAPAVVPPAQAQATITAKSTGQAPQAPPVKPGTPATKPGTPLPKDQTKSNRRFVIGCLTAFGCSLFLFIGVLFAFLIFGSEKNPIFGFLGVPQGEVVNTLITLVNLIFLVLVFVTFILVIVGFFKIATAKKDDREAKKRGMLFTFAAAGIMVFLILVWIFAYFFLSSKRTTSPRLAIITTPAETKNLTAPAQIKFDATQAPVNKRQFEILSYQWDFADGASGSDSIQTHTFKEIGNFKVKVIITVKEKTTAKEEKVEFTRDVIVSNIKANVVIKADPPGGPAPLMVNLDASESSSANGEITKYEWDLNGDGKFDESTDAKTQTTFNKIGTYKVALRVTDSTQETATAELDIEATAPDTPIPVITVEGITGTELNTGTAYIFNATQSTTPNGRIEKYSWDFGDSAKATTRTATHTFKDAGVYDVMLTVIDNEKKKGEMTQRFSVKAPTTAPLISLETDPKGANGVVSGQAPFTVVFNASGSKDPNDDIVEYAWDFNGDGKTDDANIITSYTFNTAGTYNVSLTAIDASDLSAKAQVVIKVEAAGLQARITADPIAGTVPLTVKFDATGSSYPEGTIVSYEWDFGDGGTPRIDTGVVSHQYTAVGTFSAKVTAITGDNKRASSTVPVNVRPVSVKACFQSSTSTGPSPLTVEFDPTCSTGTVVKYRWNFANLGKSTDRKPKFTFENPGDYTVTLEVSDAQNVVDTFTGKITIQAP